MSCDNDDYKKNLTALVTASISTLATMASAAKSSPKMEAAHRQQIGQVMEAIRGMGQDGTDALLHVIRDAGDPAVRTQAYKMLTQLSTPAETMAFLIDNMDEVDYEFINNQAQAYDRPQTEQSPIFSPDISPEHVQKLAARLTEPFTEQGAKGKAAAIRLTLPFAAKYPEVRTALVSSLDNLIEAAAKRESVVPPYKNSFAPKEKEEQNPLWMFARAADFLSRDDDASGEFVSKALRWAKQYSGPQKTKIGQMVQFFAINNITERKLTKAIPELIASFDKFDATDTMRQDDHEQIAFAILALTPDDPEAQQRTLDLVRRTPLNVIGCAARRGIHARGMPPEGALVILRDVVRHRGYVGDRTTVEDFQHRQVSVDQLLAKYIEGVLGLQPAIRERLDDNIPEDKIIQAYLK